MRDGVRQNSPGQASSVDGMKSKFICVTRRNAQKRVTRSMMNKLERNWTVCAERHAEPAAEYSRKSPKSVP